MEFLTDCMLFSFLFDFFISFMSSLLSSILVRAEDLRMMICQSKRTEKMLYTSAEKQPRTN